MACAKCGGAFSSPSESARCRDCSKEYHAACCRIRTVKKLQDLHAKGTPWRCDQCTGSQTSASTPDTEEPVALQFVLKGIQDELKKSREENAGNFKSLQDSVASIKTSLDEVKTRLTAVEEDSLKVKEECDDLRQENKRLNKILSGMEDTIHDLEQYTRVNNLEIRGIPYSHGENVYAILEVVARAIQVHYDRNLISIAHRLGRWPAIVVQFTSRTTRAEWTVAARGKKLKTTDLNPALALSFVYINEHLSKKNRGVLGRARALVKEERLSSAWTRDGKVFVKVTAEDTPVRVAYCEEVDNVAMPLPRQPRMPEHLSSRDQDRGRNKMNKDLAKEHSAAGS